MIYLFPSLNPLHLLSTFTFPPSSMTAEKARFQQAERMVNNFSLNLNSFLSLLTSSHLTSFYLTLHLHYTYTKLHYTYTTLHYTYTYITLHLHYTTPTLHLHYTYTTLTLHLHYTILTLHYTYTTLNYTTLHYTYTKPTPGISLRRGENFVIWELLIFYYQQRNHNNRKYLPPQQADHLRAQVSDAP